MLYYVSIKNVSDEQLKFLGYILVSEDADTRLYRHFGEDILVDRADPFIYVDDLNDAILLGGETVTVPARK